jgi:hypothetical protein
MFTKFAKAEILDVRSSSHRVSGAKLNKFASIGEDNEPDYRLQDGYIYTKVRAISSRVNKNHDGWPSEELGKAYSTFVGKPIFVDHNNSDPSRARGVVIDARLHVEEDLQKASALDPYYSAAPDNHKPPTWIELLLETDARQFPRLAKAIISGDIDSVSMGANVERTQCNICDNWATSTEEYCDHVHSKGAEFDFVSSTGERQSRRSYEDCYDIGFFEISYVFDPADETALVLDKISKTAKSCKCWEGYKRVPGTTPCAPGSCEKCDSHTKTAQKPQVDLERAPDKVNTLRQEKVCDVCGNSMEDGKCGVCGYEQPDDALLNDHAPPESLSDPDIPQAQKNIEERQQGELDIPGSSPAATTRAPAPGLPTPYDSRPSAPGGASLQVATTVKGKNSTNIKSEWTITKSGGLVTRIEKPILPPNRITSDKVVNPKQIKKSQKPVESNNKENNSIMSDQESKLDKALEQLTQYLSTKTAAEPIWSDPNEQEANLEAVGGEMTGDAEKATQQEALIQAPAQDMTAPHTQTFPNKNQADPVSSEVGSAGQGPIGVAASTKDESEEEDNDEDKKDKKKKKKDKKKDLPAFMMKEKEAGFEDDLDIMERDDMPMEHREHPDLKHSLDPELLAALDAMSADELLDLAEKKMSVDEGEEPMGHEIMEEGGDHIAKTKKSVEYFNAENTALQVDVAAPLREEVGPETQTFKSDPMHVGQPVTTDGNGNQVGGPIGQAVSKGELKAHIFRALKVAEIEVALGLTPEEGKFDRAGTLEDETPAELKVREETLAKVKQANLSKPISKRVAGRVPSLKTAGILHSHIEPNSIEIEDSALFS